MGVESLGQLLKKLRKEQKMSQQQLALAVRMSRATISGLENNSVAEVGLRKVENLFSVLGYSLTATPISKRPRLSEVVKEGGFHRDSYERE